MNTNRHYGWEREDPAFYLCCVLLFLFIRLHLEISQLNFYVIPLFLFRAVIARGMATEKQSESMQFYLSYNCLFSVETKIITIHIPRITFPQFGTKFNLPKISRKLPHQ